MFHSKNRVSFTCLGGVISPLHPVSQSMKSSTPPSHISDIDLWLLSPSSITWPTVPEVPPLPDWSQGGVWWSHSGVTDPVSAVVEILVINTHPAAQTGAKQSAFIDDFFYNLIMKTKSHTWDPLIYYSTGEQCDGGPGLERDRHRRPESQKEDPACGPFLTQGDGSLSIDWLPDTDEVHLLLLFDILINSEFQYISVLKGTKF